MARHWSAAALCAGLNSWQFRRWPREPSTTMRSTAGRQCVRGAWVNRPAPSRWQPCSCAWHAASPQSTCEQARRPGVCGLSACAVSGARAPAARRDRAERLGQQEKRAMPRNTRGRDLVDLEGTATAAAGCATLTGQPPQPCPAGWLARAVLRAPRRAHRLFPCTKSRNKLPPKLALGALLADLGVAAARCAPSSPLGFQGGGDAVPARAFAGEDGAASAAPKLPARRPRRAAGLRVGRAPGLPRVSARAR